MPQFTVFKGSKDQKVIQSQSTRDVGPNEVLLRVTHSGLCGTDVHYKGADMVLGHEGVGVVEQVGGQVTLHKKGDRVGWGYNHSCCNHCRQCLSGADIFCPERQLYGAADLDQGSFATHAVWNENFVFGIPEGLASEHAAPLQCGGITVYSALQTYPVSAGERVGVIGVGGLGHLAIQFAAKMGCEVVVFSGTDSKKDEALKLGAKEFYATKDKKELKLEGNKGIDRLIITASVQIDWALYMPLMNPRGSIYPLSVSQDDLKVPYMALLTSGLRVQGSVVGSKQIHKDMLAFAAAQGIKPIIETFPLNEQGIHEAFDKLENGKMRYRGVLVVEN